MRGSNRDVIFYYKHNQLLLGLDLKTKLQTPAGADSNFYLLKNASKIKNNQNSADFFYIDNYYDKHHACQYRIPKAGTTLQKNPQKSIHPGKKPHF